MPTLTPGMALATLQPDNAPFYLVWLDVVGDPTWAWTGPFDRQFSIPGDPLLNTPQNFIGAGNIAAISGVTHNADGTVAAMTMLLNDPDFTDNSANDFINNIDLWFRRPAVVWLGFYEVATGLAVANPVRIFTGEMRHTSVTDGATPSIALKVVGKAVSQGLRANGWSLSDAHQKAFYPADTALQYILQLVGKELRFGVANDRINQGGSNALARFGGVVQQV